MVKDKKRREVTDVYVENDKYICTECNTELPLRQSCPVCKKEVDREAYFWSFTIKQFRYPSVYWSLR